MDARVRELVKATIPVLKEHGVALTTYFYQRLFRHNPELKNIFNQSHNETGKQPVALAMAVLAYAENIDDPSVLAPVITMIAHMPTLPIVESAPQAAGPADNLIDFDLSELPFDKPPGAGR